MNLVMKTSILMIFFTMFLFCLSGAAGEDCPKTNVITKMSSGIAGEFNVKLEKSRW